MVGMVFTYFCPMYVMVDTAVTRTTVIHGSAVFNVSSAQFGFGLCVCVLLCIHIIPTSTVLVSIPKLHAPHDGISYCPAVMQWSILSMHVMIDTKKVNEHYINQPVHHIFVALLLYHSYLLEWRDSF